MTPGSQHEGLTNVFCGVVEGLEKIFPRPAVVSALNAALSAERRVDELIAAADAEEGS